MNQQNFEDIGDRINHVELILHDLGDQPCFNELRQFVQEAKTVEQIAQDEFASLLIRI